jgi:hypothetical protein
MNREDIIRMAKNSGLFVELVLERDLDWLEAFAALVASAERERILDICKEGLWDAEGIRYHLDIRARGQA